MQIQRVFKAGNSSVVTIPKSLADKYEITEGEKVVVDEIPNVGIVIKKAVKSAPLPTNQKVNKEFEKWLEGALTEDAEILNQLA